MRWREHRGKTLIRSEPPTWLWYHCKESAPGHRRTQRRIKNNFPTPGMRFGTLAVGRINKTNTWRRSDLHLCGDGNPSPDRRRTNVRSWCREPFKRPASRRIHTDPRVRPDLLLGVQRSPRPQLHDLPAHTISNQGRERGAPWVERERGEGEDATRDLFAWAEISPILFYL